MIEGSQGRRNERSRSGSITRYEYDVSDSRKVTINGRAFPVEIKLKRSESPLEAPYHTVVKSPRKV